MLQDSRDWEWDADIPGPPGPSVARLRILHDGGTAILTPASADGRATRAELAVLLRSKSYLLTIKPSNPRIMDHVHNGLEIKAVVVVTEALQTIPFPPARRPELRRILILDCRAVLGGFQWLLSVTGSFDLQELANLFTDTCPADYLVGFKGAEIRDGLLFFSHGQVIKIEFIPGASLDASSSGGGGAGRSSSSEPASDHSEDFSLGGREAMSLDASPSADDGSDNTTRSRSERGGHTLALSLGLCRACRPAVPEESFVGASMLRYLLVGFWHLLCCRLLHVYPSGSPAQQSVLDRLRSVTQQMGHPWRYQIWDQGWPMMSDQLGDDEEAEGMFPAVSLNFAILVAGYTAEYVTIELDLPATVAEALDAVSDAREHIPASLFPCLTVVSPQPCPGSGCLLASTRWNQDKVWVCIDCSALDGRVFAAACPPYVNPTQILHLANVPVNAGLTVGAGVSQTQVADDALLHVNHGDLFSVRPPDSVGPELFGLEQALLYRSAWASTSTFPSAFEHNAYAFVLDQDTILYIHEAASPMTYREQLARCIGCPSQGLRIFPARPKIRDCAIDGLPCRAGAAVYDARDGEAQRVVLIDARPLGLGFCSCTVLTQENLENSLIRAVSFEAPPGWRVKITRSEAPLSDPIDNGQVFCAELSQFVTRSLDSLPADSSSPTLLELYAAVLAPESGQVASLSGAMQPASGHGAPRADNPTSSASSAPVPHGQESIRPSVAEDDAAAGASAFANRAFLVLGQNYAPELVWVRLPLGCPTADALQAVSNARAPLDRCQLPNLVGAFPQPLRGIAVAVAIPNWIFLGVVCVFDCTQVGGSLFALRIANRVTREGLLIAAGFGDSELFAVFIGTQPWALPNAVWVELHTGDTISLVPPLAAQADRVSTEEFLSSPENLHIDDLLPGRWEEAAWVLHSGDDFRFVVPVSRRSYVRQDLAAVVGVPHHELTVRPACPAISDHAYRGALARNVLAVCRVRGQHYSAPRDPIAILDARPLLLNITWVFCPGGLLCVPDVRDRFAVFCPSGYRVGIIRGHEHVARTTDAVYIEDGEPLVIVFVPDAYPLDSAGDEDDDAYDFRGPTSHRFLSRPGIVGDGLGSFDGLRSHDSTGGTFPPGDSGASSSCSLRAGSLPNCRAPVADVVNLISRPQRSSIPQLRSSSSLRAFPCLRKSVVLQVVILGDFFTVASAVIHGIKDFAGHERRALPTPCRNRDMLPIIQQSERLSPPFAADMRRSPNTQFVPRLPGHEKQCFRIADYLPLPAADRVLDWPAGLQLPPVDDSARTVLGADYDKPLAYGDVPLGFTPRQLHELFRPAFSCLSLRESLQSLSGALHRKLFELVKADGSCLESGTICYTDGSFTSDTSAGIELTGWACVFLNKEARTCDVIAGTLPDWCFAGNCASAFKAECCIVGLWLGISALQGQSFTIASDCQAALAIATGQAAAHSEGVAQVLSHVASCCRDAAGAPPAFQYTPGHKNILGNEIADVAAKAAASGTNLGVFFWSRDPGLDW